MADIGASNWSETDASNNQPAPDGAPELMAPDGVNNTMRAMMGAIKRWYDWSIPKVTGGTSTAYTLSYTVPPGALVDGMPHVVQFNATCGASPTLNVNSLGAKSVHKYVSGAWGVCAAGDLPANMVAKVSYNATDGTYRIISTGRNWLDILTTRGDLLTRDASGYKRLALGTAGQVLSSDGTDAVWSTIAGFTTGDAKLTLKTVADSGWVMMDDGTIGNASSGATTRANADTAALFALLWNNISNTYAAVSGGRGASAAADFAANKTIALTKQLGRAFLGAGAGSGLTARALGETGGNETRQASTYLGNAGSGWGYGADYTPITQGTYNSAAFSVMPPYAAWNIMIKL